MGLLVRLMGVLAYGLIPGCLQHPDPEAARLEALTRTITWKDASFLEP